MNAPITTKVENLAALAQGLLGNKLRHWSDWDALRLSGYGGDVTVRSRAVAGSCTYSVPTAWTHQTAAPDVYYNESAPDHRLILQGEVQRDTEHLTLFYSTEQAKMRHALHNSGHHAQGIVAKELLKARLWPSSYDDLMELLDLYPDHIIEFSAYDVALGDCRHRNTVIWEVRNY